MRTNEFIKPLVINEPRDDDGKASIKGASPNIIDKAIRVEIVHPNTTRNY